MDTGRILKLVIILLLNVTIILPAHAATYKSVQHGNWESAATWDLAGTPDDGDTVIISAEDTVLINNPNLSYDGPMLIIIEGGLEFDNGKLVLDEGSTIVIEEGGVVFGEGNGNNDKIRIDNTTVWSTNDGPQYGYQVWGTPLPLAATFVSFNVDQTENGSAKIKWSTISEKNNDYFIVQKSTDGLNFTDLAQIEAKGKLLGYVEYSYVDEQFVEEAYYRLVQVENDGSQHVNNQKYLRDSRQHALQFEVYPNPSTDGNVYFSSGNAESTTFHAQIFDMYGKLVQEMSFVDSFGDNLLTSKQLSSGTYLVRFNTGSLAQTKKIVVQ